MKDDDGDDDDDDDDIKMAKKTVFHLGEIRSRHREKWSMEAAHPFA